jgi:murein DD-endopeptidase MepM/ murein hydrolase activator NlpD
MLGCKKQVIFLFWLLFLPVFTLYAAVEKAPAKTEDTSSFTKVTIRRGEAFSTVMQRIGVSYRESLAIVESVRGNFNLNRVQPGQVMYYKVSGRSYPVLSELRIDIGDREVRYFESEHRSRITGKTVTATPQLRTTSVAELKAVNQKSMQFIEKLFACRINWKKGGIDDNDKVTVLCERYEDEYGNFVKEGALEYVALKRGGKTYTAYLYEGRYYDEKGHVMEARFLNRPLEKLHVTSGFGWRRHPVRRFRDFHGAVDYRAARGTPVMAAADGVIESIKHNDYWLGNHVIIRHSNGWKTVYGHFSNFGESVKKGRKITAGTIVGYAGDTGMATGPHLHFGLYRGSELVDPRPYLFHTVEPQEEKSLEDELQFGQVFTSYRKDIEKRVKSSLKI